MFWEVDTVEPKCSLDEEHAFQKIKLNATVDEEEGSFLMIHRKA